MNTGAEAVETGVKLARRWGYDVKGVADNEAHLLFASDNFHGRTLTAISASNDPSSYDRFGPFLPGISRVEYNNIQDLKQALESNSNIVGFVVEPVQGEAGVIVPSDTYLKEAYDLCKKHNVLFIADEIQCGLGRTGAMLCSDQFGVKPDMIFLGKALSGGVLPVSAVLCDDEIMLTIKPGEHGSTYGGNPLACKVGIEALKVLQEEGMVENAREMGDVLMDGLKGLESDRIKEVRGKGLFCAVEIEERDGEDETAFKMCHDLMERGMLCKPTHNTIIRLSPPLIINKPQIEECLEIFQRMLNEF